MNSSLALNERRVERKIKREREKKETKTETDMRDRERRVKKKTKSLQRDEKQGMVFRSELKISPNCLDMEFLHTKKSIRMSLRNSLELLLVPSYS